MTHEHCCSDHHHHGECGSHHHHHDECGSHHHHHGDCCSHHHEHDDFAHQLIEMADEAWMEVLKEKIKEQIKSANGSHLDQLAKIISESNSARWTQKMALNKGQQGFRDKIHDFFNR